MSEISFAKNPETNPSTPVVECATVQTPTPVAGVAVESVNTVAPACQVPAVQSRHASPALLLGDVIPSFDQIIVPRLNLTQNIGELKDSFSPGSVVYNQQVCLYSPQRVNKATGQIDEPGTAPVTVICLGFKPMRYVEKIAGGVRGLLVGSEAEVKANGGTTDWQEWNLKKASGIKLFQPMAEALMLVQRPAIVADDDATFGYEVEGNKWALALWSLKGTAYTQAYKKVFATARAMGVLRSGYPTHVFSLATRLDTFSGTTNTAWVPVVLPLVKTSPALLDFAKGVLSGE